MSLSDSLDDWVVGGAKWVSNQREVLLLASRPSEELTPTKEVMVTEKRVESRKAAHCPAGSLVAARVRMMVEEEECKS